MHHAHEQANSSNYRVVDRLMAGLALGAAVLSLAVARSPEAMAQEVNYQANPALLASPLLGETALSAVLTGVQESEARSDSLPAAGVDANANTETVPLTAADIQFVLPAAIAHWRDSPCNSPKVITVRTQPARDTARDEIVATGTKGDGKGNLMDGPTDPRSDMRVRAHRDPPRDPSDPTPHEHRYEIINSGGKTNPEPCSFTLLERRPPGPAGLELVCKDEAHELGHKNTKISPLGYIDKGRDPDGDIQHAEDEKSIMAPDSGTARDKLCRTRVYDRLFQTVFDLVKDTAAVRALSTIVIASKSMALKCEYAFISDWKMLCYTFNKKLGHVKPIAGVAVDIESHYTQDGEPVSSSEVMTAARTKTLLDQRSNPVRGLRLKDDTAYTAAALAQEAVPSIPRLRKALDIGKNVVCRLFKRGKNTSQHERVLCHTGKGKRAMNGTTMTVTDYHPKHGKPQVIVNPNVFPRSMLVPYLAHNSTTTTPR